MGSIAAGWCVGASGTGIVRARGVCRIWNVAEAVDAWAHTGPCGMETAQLREQGRMRRHAVAGARAAGRGLGSLRRAAPLKRAMLIELQSCRKVGTKHK